MVSTLCRSGSYLLDPHTKLLFVDPGDGSWPRLAAKLVNGQVTERPTLRRPGELFSRLDEHLRTHKMR